MFSTKTLGGFFIFHDKINKQNSITLDNQGGQSVISGKTKLAGFFANPAEHSLSPRMHNRGFQACGVDAVYLAFEVDQTNLARAIESIRTLDMLGVNLSMPNKTTAIAYVDELSQEAQLIGAINTIVNQNGKLMGYNTDGIGFVKAMAETAKIKIKDKKITILGAGGAAKAITVQAALEGAREVVLYKRKNERFLTVKRDFEKIGEQTDSIVRVVDYADEEQLVRDLQTSELLVNATDIGMGKKEGQSPLAKATFLHENLFVIDLIYSPRKTQLLKEAEKIGAPAFNGLGMLLYQGATAFHLWTNHEMPLDIMKDLFE